jgi:site-specific DNA recombinase
MTTTTRRVVGYIRVSTTDQGREGTSLGSQRDALRAAHPGLVSVFEDQASGACGVADRPGLRSALEHLAALAVGRAPIRKGAPPPEDAPALAVVRRDRLARDVGVVCAIQEVLAGQGCVLLSLDVADDGGPDALLMARIFDAFAEYERHKILWRTSLGKAARRREGAWLGGHPPWGLVPQDGGWRVDEDRRDAVETVFRMEAEGETRVDIAAWLNAAGFHAARGGTWSHVQVGRMLGQRQWYTQAGVLP